MSGSRQTIDERWVETMPVLAGILRSGEPRCIHSAHEGGAVERETEFGILWRCGDHYTLCEQAAHSDPGPTYPTPRCPSCGRFIGPGCADCIAEEDRKAANLG